MSDLQHVDASREGSQEREDAGEDAAAAAPGTESDGAAAGGRKRARAAAQGATSAASPARLRLRTNLAGSFAHRVGRGGPPSRRRRISAVREKYVARTVAAGLRDAGLCKYHPEFSYLLRTFTHDHETLDRGLHSQRMEAAGHAELHIRLSRGAGGLRLESIRLHLAGLRNGPPPSGLNGLDSSISRNDGDDAKTPRAMAAIQAAPSHTPAEFPATTSSTVFGSPMAAVSTQRLCDQAPPPVTESAPTADVMARQTAAGFRAPGALLGWFFGGAAEGIQVDLSDVARRALFAHQMLAGIRPPGPLVSSPPAGELPSVASYGPPIAQPPPSAYVGPAQPLYQGSPNPWLVQSAEAAAAARTLRSAPRYWARAIHSALYRGISLPQNLTCFECNALREQYANECPDGFGGTPGWKVERGSGAVVKDPDSLAGAVAPRAEAWARVGFGPGGLAVRWRSFVRVAGWRRTLPARRPRLAREGGPQARHRGQRACSLESSCPSPFVRSCRM